MFSLHFHEYVGIFEIKTVLLVSLNNKKGLDEKSHFMSDAPQQQLWKLFSVSKYFIA